jgi:hypothetical protein
MTDPTELVSAKAELNVGVAKKEASSVPWTGAFLESTSADSTRPPPGSSPISSKHQEEKSAGSRKRRAEKTRLYCCLPE